MIWIGVAGIPISFFGTSTSEAIAKLPSLELNAMEIEFVRNIYLSKENAKDLKSIAEKAKVKLSIHAPYYINLASQKKEVIGKSKIIILRCLDVADTAGASPVVIHAGYYSGRPEKEAYDLVKKALIEIRKKYKGRSNIGIECMGKQKSFGTLNEIISLSKEIDGVVPVIDWGHYHALTNGGLKNKKDFEYILNKLKKELKIKELHTHMTCLKYENGNEKHHLSLDVRSPDYKLLADVLKKRKEEITIISESPVLEKDALLFKRWMDL